MRPAQLGKMQKHKDQIADVQAKMDKTNQENLEQIDAIYKETNELEGQFISKKMENMNLINDSEMNGIRFIHSF